MHLIVKAGRSGYPAGDGFGNHRLRTGSPLGKHFLDFKRWRLEEVG
jgi:hypothetical protein